MSHLEHLYQSTLESLEKDNPKLIENNMKKLIVCMIDLDPSEQGKDVLFCWCWSLIHQYSKNYDSAIYFTVKGLNKIYYLRRIMKKGKPKISEVLYRMKVLIYLCCEAGDLTEAKKKIINYKKFCQRNKVGYVDYDIEKLEKLLT